ncbi:hypothetical protein [Tessaracoccus sp. ZS01]|uniref:hypothetical protein n=1 Tax=Tessaracoccus sp. ZS01 TaxID=1906324 RepID=UPI00117CADF7|nr:hypothetical protein [Tessaracoccus sp. ZS01]
MTHNPPPGWQPNGPQPPQPQWGPAPQQPSQQGPQGQPQGPSFQQPRPQQPAPWGTPPPQQGQWGTPPPPQGQWGTPPQQVAGQYQPYAAAPVKKKSKAPAIVAGALALALVIGGVAFGLTFFRGATPAAAKGLPSTVVMAVELNLAPAPADQLKLARIINKFPVGEEMAETTDYKRALWDLIPDDSGDKPAYEEVEPWLGDSVALGFLGSAPDSASGFGDQVVVAVETTDKEKAEAFAAAQAAAENEYFFVDDVLVITSADLGLDAAAISESSLADDQDYKADMAKLGTGSLATFWAGSEAMDMLISQSGPGLYPMSDVEALRGSHGAAGLKVDDDRVILDGQFSAPNYPQPELDDMRAFASGLPGDVLAAVAGAGSTEAYEQSWRSFEAAGLTPDLESLGIMSAADLQALLGRQIGVTVGTDAQGQPVVGAKFISDDPARQLELLDSVKQVLMPEGSFEGLTAEQDGDTVYLAYGQGIDDIRSPATTLGDSAGFKDVIRQDASSLSFVDLNAVKSMPLYQEMAASEYSAGFTQWLEPVSALGMAVGAADDGDSTVRLEVVFN